MTKKSSCLKFLKDRKMCDNIFQLVYLYLLKNRAIDHFNYIWLDHLQRHRNLCGESKLNSEFRRYIC